MAAGYPETRLDFSVTPVRSSLPDHNAAAAGRLGKMTGGETSAVRITLVYMLMVGFTIQATDLMCAHN